jgi:hypothetical protein
MKKYNVHTYRMVRIKAAGIEAESQEEAIQKAQEIGPDELNISSCLPDGIECIEDTQEDAYYKVDEVNDKEYEHTRDHRGQFEVDEKKPVRVIVTINGGSHGGYVSSAPVDLDILDYDNMEAAKEDAENTSNEEAKEEYEFLLALENEFEAMRGNLS